MSKEIAKFQASYKKLEAGLKKYTSAEAAKMKKSFGLAVGDASASGESVVAESMADARDNGVTGDKLTDFMKDKGFKDAVATYTKSVHYADKLGKELVAFCGEAGKVLEGLTKLKGEIDKDLKSRKDKSATKTDIEKLGAQVEADMKEMKKSADTWGTVPPRQQGYCGDFDKHLARILKQAPDGQARQRDATVLPQMLVDRNRKKALSQATGALKRVNDACDAAIDAAANDLKAAQPHLKEAAAQLTALTKVRDEFKKAVDYADSKRSLEGTKDEAAVRKVLDQIDKAHTAAERKLRGTATTIKKAAA